MRSHKLSCCFEKIIYFDPNGFVDENRHDGMLSVRFDIISDPPIEGLRQTLILETANGEQIVVHGETVVQISIGSFKHETKVLVANIVDTFILGLDKILKLNK